MTNTWNAEAAQLLRDTCGLTGDALRRNLAWWRTIRRRVPDDDIAAAISGLPSIVPVTRPWWPARMLGKKTNAALWLEAMSAGRRERRPPSPEASEPTAMGETVRQLAERLGL